MSTAAPTTEVIAVSVVPAYLPASQGGPRSVYRAQVEYDDAPDRLLGTFNSRTAADEAAEAEAEAAWGYDYHSIRGHNLRITYLQGRKGPKTTDDDEE